MPILADSIPLTEQENPRTQQISSLSTADIVRLMNDEDAGVAKAVAEVLGDVASAVDQIVKRMQSAQPAIGSYFRNLSFLVIA